LTRVNFSFEEDSYNKIVLLAAQEGVSTGEVVRRALSLYANVRKVLRDEERIIVSRTNMGQI
jgi:hypothetical protein